MRVTGASNIHEVTLAADAAGWRLDSGARR
jgi:hypothetical protein